MANNTVPFFDGNEIIQMDSDKLSQSQGASQHNLPSIPSARPLPPKPNPTYPESSQEKTPSTNQPPRPVAPSSGPQPKRTPIPTPQSRQPPNEVRSHL